MDKALTQKLIIDTILEHIKGSLPKNANVPSNEGENISRLMALFFSPTKDICPREIMSSMSDPLIEHMIRNRKILHNHVVMQMIFKLFMLEWCYRNDYLFEDWKWEWSEDGKSGEAHANPRVPFTDIILP